MAASSYLLATHDRRQLHAGPAHLRWRTAAQPGYAAHAACSARSASSMPPAAMVPTTSVGRAGLEAGDVSFSIHSPSITNWYEAPNRFALRQERAHVAARFAGSVKSEYGSGKYGSKHRGSAYSGGGQVSQHPASSCRCVRS